MKARREHRETTGLGFIMKDQIVTFFVAMGGLLLFIALGALLFVVWSSCLLFQSRRKAES
jgi:hypothetical protein